MKKYCYVTHKNYGVYIDCSYDPDFIETLKRHIPSKYRSWYEDTEEWWVSREHKDQAVRDCKAFFDNVIEC